MISYFPTQIIEDSGAKFSHNGYVEDYGDIARVSRRQINYLATNGTDIPAILHGHVSGVVGSSVNIQSTYPDKEIQKQFEELLAEHSASYNFSARSRFGRNEGFRNMERFKVMQGGVLIRYHYIPVNFARSPKRTIPFGIDLIGVDRIDTAMSDGKKIKNGLEKDRYGRITYIWLFGDDKNKGSKRYSTRNIDYYSPLWMDLSQYTAVSRLVTVLSAITQKDNYFNEELKAAIERAKAGVYWSTELYSPIMEAFNEQVDKSDAATEAKSIIEELAKRGVNATGATPIPQEDKIHKLENTTGSVIDSFTQQHQKGIAASVGGSAVTTYKDIGIGNYASIKAAIAYDEEGYKIEFDNLSEIISEYNARLFTVGVQMGRISVDRSDYFSNKFKYHKWDILRVSKRSVDEKVESVAIKNHLESGATTKVKVYGEKGLDFITEQKKQIEADIEVEKMRAKMFKQAGVQQPQGDA